MPWVIRYPLVGRCHLHSILQDTVASERASKEQLERIAT